MYAAAGAQVFLFLIAATVAAGAYSSDYCNSDLCNFFDGTKFVVYDHIGCGNNGSLSPNCGDGAELAEMTPERIKLLLDLHNAARNRIAIGKVPGFNSAASMPVVKWDNELAYLASLNVRTCFFGHDDCRNTNRFQYSGQNIGYMWQTQPFRSLTRRIKFLVGQWFFEYQDASQDFIDSFKFHPEGKKIGHFTVMVADRVQRIGCAAITYSAEPLLGYRFLLACNYDFTNIGGGLVYASGEPASKCAARQSDRYEGLCEWDDDNDESNEIDLNLPPN